MERKRNLLVEIGTEELPPKALLSLVQAFADGITGGLKKAGLSHGTATPYATPRRLALLIEELDAGQADREMERRGPALAAAFDEEGVATKAAEGFARSCGVEVGALQTLETDKGSWLVHRVHEKGQATSALLPAIVEAALAGLPIPKRMRWGASDAEFVRPVHWAVLLFGDEVVETDILGVTTGRHTRGHRFHHPAPLYLGEPEAYAPLLESEGRVIADFGDRREAIRAQVMEAAAALNGRAVMKEALLDEVTALVEWPVAVSGGFDPRFLEVPAEALISSMQDHQKYFPVVDESGRLLPHFITVANIDSRDIGEVRAGNERVIRPRLTDAAFFWDQDRKTPLAERVESLHSIVFQKQLGTLFQKTEQVVALAGGIAEAIGGKREAAEQAARISKCDLMTDMVFEFPELQGIMGRYYALHDGYPDDVAAAQEEQYMPRFAGDELPATATGQAVAIADRLFTLVGIFGIGQPPSGSKDPFALRRAALGLVRTIIERHLDLDLAAHIDAAVAGLSAQGVKLVPDTASQVFDFVYDRLRAYYQDQGFSVDTFDAVHAVRPTRPLDFDARLRAVDGFRKLPEAESLAAANKRIGNILKKADEAVPEAVDAAALVEAQEQSLARELGNLQTEVVPLLDQGDYGKALERLAALREPVDAFFDAVMVMAEDAAVRRNRLALLSQLNRLFLRTADISLLQE